VRTFSTKGFKGAYGASHGRAWVRSLARSAATGASDRRGILPSPARLLACCGHRAAALPRPSGREPYGRGGCRAPLASTRLDRCSAVARGGCGCKSGLAVPSRRASCHRAKITVKGRACGASSMALRATP
jgi:hypothetical protein